MSDLDDILNDVGLIESDSKTEVPTETPVETPTDDPVENIESNTESEGSSEEKDPDVEELSDDQRDAEKKIDIDPVFDEDNPEYLMSKETAETFLEFGNRYMNLMLEKKRLAQDIKALKQEFAEQGVSVNAAARALNLLNSEHKKTKTEIAELEMLKKLFSKSKEILDKIADVNAKD